MNLTELISAAPGNFVSGMFLLLSSVMTIINAVILKQLENKNKTKKEEQELLKKLDYDISKLKEDMVILSNNQKIIKEGTFLSLESAELSFIELHDKGVLNGSSLEQRRKIRAFYQKCAKDSIEDLKD